MGTRLYRASYLGSLPGAGQVRYFVFVAYPCGGSCVNGPFLYVLGARQAMSGALYVGEPPGTEYIIGRPGPWARIRVFLGTCLLPADSQLVSLWHPEAASGATDSITTLSPAQAEAPAAGAALTSVLEQTIESAVRSKRCRELRL